MGAATLYRLAILTILSLSLTQISAASEDDDFWIESPELTKKRGRDAHQVKQGELVKPEKKKNKIREQKTKGELRLLEKLETFKKKRKSKKKGKKRARDKEVTAKDTRSKKSKKIDPAKQSRINYEHNSRILTKLLPLDLWFDLIHDYCDTRTIGSLKKSCNYLNEIIIYPRIWERLVKTEKILHSPFQYEYKNLVAGHMRIPKVFLTDSYSPTQNFFFEFVDLSRAVYLGSIEATYHLRHLLTFRGHHYMLARHNNMFRVLSERLISSLEELEGSFEETAIHHLLLGHSFRHGHGQVRNLASAKDHYKNALALGDPRAAIELGRLYEKPPRGFKGSRSKAIRHYSLAAEKGSTLGLIKLGHLYLRERNFTAASSAFNKAVKCGDARGYRGLYYTASSFESLTKVNPRNNKMSDLELEAYLQSDDAFAYVLYAENQNPQTAQRIYQEAWYQGLTSQNILREAFFGAEFEVIQNIRARVDNGYCNVFEGILEHNPEKLGSAMALFTASGHHHFVDKIRQVLRRDFQ